jgi:TPR repeat protein
MYYKKKEYENAKFFYKEASENGDRTAMYDLSIIYLKVNNNVNYNEVRKLLEKSASLGQLRASFVLSKLFIGRKYGYKNILKGICMLFFSIICAFRVAIRNPNDPGLR